MAMKVVAARLTDDIASTKFVYVKNGLCYVRSGADGFKTGQPLQCSVDALDKWGFRKVENPPQFRDRHELIQAIPKFELKVTGEVVYSE